MHLTDAASRFSQDVTQVRSIAFRTSPLSLIALW